MQHSDISSYLNIILIAINISIGLYTFSTNQKSNRINPIIDHLLHKVFIPFQNTIGKSLFKEVDDQNINTIHKNLTLLYDEIHNTDLEFALSYTTTYYLQRILNLGIPTNVRQFKKYNYEYKNFSHYYYKDLNKFRRKSGLPRYSNMYRINFGLYKNKIWVYSRHFYYYLLLITSIFFIELLIYWMKNFN
ncbi:hypothetical protein ACK4CS_16250 [Enterococcus gallinarum]|uniref:Uncharacterized protein n=1 Tax=Enterococcus gallinarum TaxID=1353 RepID=A0AAE4L1S1_ENTGA|nr:MULTISPECIES: hypothetical protein [Enterococcus]MBM6740229.1 hypothetical protein [Enterococcus gallinarum]MBO6417874.1 hypothetical protein [Enterococcus gallinarum]MBO6422750.1 hypothetical protein [Enterococcus gallinarum]MDT2682793.1 hypothetical protein [Enterococcus gallinarum]MDT2685607.1 hypothetical protein [Enterococcus gallinarum]